MVASVIDGDLHVHQGITGEDASVHCLLNTFLYRIDIFLGY